MKNGHTKNPKHSGYQTPCILSIGYEKRETESFLETLSEHQIQAVVDVRESAFSRRLDFRKQRLTALLKGYGIKYFHLRNAGNPHRKTSHNIEKCLEMYRDHISNDPLLLNEIAGELSRISQSFPRLAILCYEKSANECHRKILINILKANEFLCTVTEV